MDYAFVACQYWAGVGLIGFVVLCLGSICSGPVLKRLRRCGHGRDTLVQGQWFIYNTTQENSGGVYFHL